MDNKKDSLSVPLFSCTLPLNDDEKCIEEAEKIVLTLRKDWHKAGLKHEFFTEGITNKILSLWHEKTGADDRILIRVFGEKTDYVIDREEELRNWHLLVENDCAAPVLCTFGNGLACRYVPGVALETDTVREKRICVAVAKAMVKQHMIVMDGGTLDPCVFTKLAAYIRNMPSHYEDPARQLRFAKCFPAKDELLEEVEQLKRVAAALDSPIVFCHNDLLLKNVIYNQDTNTASFIDYEYAGANYQAYDIADHFAEFPGVAETLDYESIFPEKQFQLDWLQTYLQFWHQTNDLAAPTVRDVERLYVQVNKLVPLAHFYWSVWSCIQAAHSTIDFDFLEYGITRRKEYIRTKQLFFPLELPD